MPFHHHDGCIPFFDALTPQALCFSFQDRVSVDAGHTPLGEITDGLRVESKGCRETDSEKGMNETHVKRLADDAWRSMQKLSVA